MKKVVDNLRQLIPVSSEGPNVAKKVKTGELVVNIPHVATVSMFLA